MYKRQVNESKKITNQQMNALETVKKQILEKWENTGVHRDIGVIETLLVAQEDFHPEPCWTHVDVWMEDYLKHPIHEYLSNAKAGIQ